ncbi:MAG: hypothetical protein AAGC54_09250, partial [Cyanobacteria bacterium P01_F01_bin.4]
ANIQSLECLGDASTSRTLDAPNFLSDDKALDGALSNLQKMESNLSEMAESTAIFLNYKGWYKN